MCDNYNFTYLLMQLLNYSDIPLMPLIGHKPSDFKSDTDLTHRLKKKYSYLALSSRIYDRSKFTG